MKSILHHSWWFRLVGDDCRGGACISMLIPHSVCGCDGSVWCGVRLNPSRRRRRASYVSKGDRARERLEIDRSCQCKLCRDLLPPSGGIHPRKVLSRQHLETRQVASISSLLVYGRRRRLKSWAIYQNNRRNNNGVITVARGDVGPGSSSVWHLLGLSHP